MAKTEKIFRDPLYDYVVIDRVDDEWLLDLIAAREVQRLRRIRQLGVSHYTYPGAEHSRLAHTLGVLHLMQKAWDRIKSFRREPRFRLARDCVLAAAVLHDVGHGPFSHLFESALEIDHEYWSCEIVRSEETEVHRRLVKQDIPIDHVVGLIEKENRERPPWEKTLLSSELDVDRLDYLRRDSYFTGAGFGHYDWYRILNTFTLHTTDEGFEILVWPDQAKYAIEEYIFARFYLYNNVYQHKTTRGFETVVNAVWRRAKQIRGDGGDASLIPEIAAFLDAEKPTVEQFLAMEDATLIYQMNVWKRHSDNVLSDLARRFLERDRLSMIEDPVPEGALDDEDVRARWERQLREVVAGNGFDPPEFYALRDDLKLSVYNPYTPEKEKKEQDPYNAIFIQERTEGAPREISEVLPRLAPVVGPPKMRYRYYVPNDCVTTAKSAAESAKWLKAPSPPPSPQVRGS